MYSMYFKIEIRYVVCDRNSMMFFCIFVIFVKVRNNGENNFFGWFFYYVVCFIMLDVVFKDDGMF